MFGLPIVILRPALAINLNAIHSAGHIAVPPSWLEPTVSSWFKCSAGAEPRCSAPHRMQPQMGTCISVYRNFSQVTKELKSDSTSTTAL